MERISKEAGVTVVSPHRLRASIATIMLNNDNNEFSLSDISEMLGHADTLITQKAYAIYNTKKLKSVAEKLELLYGHIVAS